MIYQSNEMLRSEGKNQLAESQKPAASPRMMRQLDQWTTACGSPGGATPSPAHYSEGMDTSLLLALTASAPENLSIFDPVSPPAGAIRNLSWLVFAITGGILLVVEGVLFYAIYRFRRDRTASTNVEPPQVY